MKIPAVLTNSKKNMSFRDTNQIIHGYQCINPEDERAVIDCRIYTGLRSYSTRIIAAVWIHDRKNNRFAHGVGIDRGHGYHRGSQAVELALMEMGIELDREIGGYGYDECVKAFHALMGEMGYSSYITAEFHP
jgi:hypothetical protein